MGVRVQRPSSHYCKICDITTTSAQHMAMHVAGKVQFSTTVPRERSMPSPRPFHCIAQAMYRSLSGPLRVRLYLLNRHTVYGRVP